MSLGDEIRDLRGLVTDLDNRLAELELRVDPDPSDEALLAEFEDMAGRIGSLHGAQIGDGLGALLSKRISEGVTCVTLHTGDMDPAADPVTTRPVTQVEDLFEMTEIAHSRRDFRFGPAKDSKISNETPATWADAGGATHYVLWGTVGDDSFGDLHELGDVVPVWCFWCQDHGKPIPAGHGFTLLPGAVEFAL